MIVVDTGSTDRTVEIAESFGAKVVHFPWNGSFADARNVSHRGRDRRLADLPRRRRAHGGRRTPATCARLLGRTWREGFYLVETNYTGGVGRRLGRHAHGAAALAQPARSTGSSGRIHEQKTHTMPTYLPERFETTPDPRAPLRLPEPAHRLQGQVAPQHRAARAGGRRSRGRRSPTTTSAPSTSSLARARRGRACTSTGPGRRCASRACESVGYAPLLVVPRRPRPPRGGRLRRPRWPPSTRGSRASPTTPTSCSRPRSAPAAAATCADAADARRALPRDGRRARRVRRDDRRRHVPRARRCSPRSAPRRATGPASEAALPPLPAPSTPTTSHPCCRSPRLMIARGVDPAEIDRLVPRQGARPAAGRQRLHRGRPPGTTPSAGSAARSRRSRRTPPPAWACPRRCSRSAATPRRPRSPPASRPTRRSRPRAAEAVVFAPPSWPPDEMDAAIERAAAEPRRRGRRPLPRLGRRHPRRRAAGRARHRRRADRVADARGAPARHRDRRLHHPAGRVRAGRRCPSGSGASCSPRCTCGAASSSPPPTSGSPSRRRSPTPRPCSAWPRSRSPAASTRTRSPSPPRRSRSSRSSRAPGSPTTLSSRNLAQVA